jgi:TolB-like protein
MVEFDGFRLDFVNRTLAAPDGSPVTLTPRLFDTLAFLTERPGRLIEKRALMEAVWGRVIVEENTLSRTISTLRHLLGESAGANRFIATVSGVGYRFLPAVRTVGPGPVQSTGTAYAIAVLPFENLSADDQQKHFGSGLAEELIMQLSAISSLKVIAKASAFLLAGESLRTVRTSLGVSHVITGAVRQSAARLRINLQLIDANTEQYIWSGQYDRLIDDILAVQEDIARAVAQALRATLGFGARVVRASSTRNSEAYDLYLRGKAAWARGMPDGFPGAIELMQQAVRIDPDFALAWSYIAVLARNLMIVGHSGADELRSIARSAASHALRLEPQWWTGHVAQAALSQLHRNWSEMERSLLRAAEFAPSFPYELNFNWWHFHFCVGDLVAAGEYLREGVAQDPISYASSAIYQLQLHFEGREEEAEKEYQRSLDLPGGREMIEMIAVHRAWTRGGDFTQQYRRFLDYQTFPVPVLASLFGKHTRPPLCIPLLRQALAEPSYQDPTRQLMLGWWLAAFGDDETVLVIMRRAYGEMGHANVSWLWFPVFARVRKLAGFGEILRLTGLEEYWRSRQNWGDRCAVGADGSVRCS